MLPWEAISLRRRPFARKRTSFRLDFPSALRAGTCIYIYIYYGLGMSTVKVSNHNYTLEYPRLVSFLHDI